MSWNGIYTIFIRFGYCLCFPLAPWNGLPSSWAIVRFCFDLWSFERIPTPHIRQSHDTFRTKKQHLRGQVVKAVVWNYLQPLIFHPSSFVCVNSERSDTEIHGSQVMLQPGFPRRKILLTEPPFGVRLFDVAMIWPQKCHTKFKLVFQPPYSEGLHQFWRM